SRIVSRVCASEAFTSSSSRLLCFESCGRPLKVSTTSRLTLRTRSSEPLLRSRCSGVSNTSLDSKTRGLTTRKPLLRSRPRAAAGPGTASLISTSSESGLLWAVATVMFAELLVDLLAAGEALIHAVPIGNGGFSQFPAQVHLAAAKQGREVEEAYIEVFDH